MSKLEQLAKLHSEEIKKIAKKYHKDLTLVRGGKTELERSVDEAKINRQYEVLFQSVAHRYLTEYKVKRDCQYS